MAYDYDLNYLKSVSGMLKVFTMVCVVELISVKKLLNNSIFCCKLILIYLCFYICICSFGDQICCQLGFLALLVSEVKLRNARATYYSVVIWLTFLCTTMILGLRTLGPIHWQWPTNSSTTSITSIKCEFYTLSILAAACFSASAVAITLDLVSYTIATVR